MPTHSSSLPHPSAISAVTDEDPADRILANIGFAITPLPERLTPTPRTPIKLNLLPPTSPFLRRRSRAVPTPYEPDMPLGEVMGPRDTWPIMLRTAYAADEARLEDVLADLRVTFDRYPCYGLAAPQVGIMARIILVRGNDRALPTTIINPVIVSKSGERRGPEHCLSVPGVKRVVRRASKLVVEGLDENGNPLILNVSGLYATVIQHEVDHLDGVLMTDR